MRAIILAGLLFAAPALARGGAGYLGATVGVSPSTIGASWTSGSANATTFECNGKAALDAGTQTSTTAHSGILAGLPSSTAYWCRALSGGTVAAQFKVWTAAAQVSTPLTAVSFLTSASEPVVGQAHADTFYNCLSNDNTHYVTADDNTNTWNISTGETHNQTIGKFVSESPLTGANVNVLSDYGGSSSQTDGTLTWKLSGLFCQQGSLFAYTQRQDVGTSYTSTGIAQHYDGSILRSDDHGVHWANFTAPTTTTSTTGAKPSPGTTGMFGAGSQQFATASFVMYGADDGTLRPQPWIDNSDAYVYLIANNGSWDNGNSLYLARVPRARLADLSASDYQYFVSGDGSLDANWTSTYASAAPILTSTGRLGYSSMHYLASVNRYILFTWYYPNPSLSGDATKSTVWVTYEGPHPWGPWTSINTNSFTTQGFYNPVALIRSQINFKPDSDAGALTLMFSGDYNAVQQATMYRFWTLQLRVNTH